MPRMRTIEGIVNYCKEVDPDTTVNAHWVRKEVKSRRLKHHKAGSKYLIDLDYFLEYLKNPPELQSEEAKQQGKIRKIS